MKIKLVFLLSSILITQFLRIDIYSQETKADTLFKVLLRDDTEFVGKITGESAEKLIMETPAGTKIEIIKTQIKERSIADGFIEEGKYVRLDPNRCRLFFAPTGRMLKARKGYFSDFLLFFPSVTVGAADYLSLSAGVSILPGLENQMVYFAPRVGFYENDEFGIGAGAIYCHIMKENFGIVYSTGTYSFYPAALTIGIGYGFSNGEVANYPGILLGGEVQLSNRSKLITENWILSGGSGTIFMFGLRFFGEHVAADFGLMTSSKAEGNFPFIPWVGIAYNF